MTEKSHPIAIFLSNRNFWCFACDEEVEHELLNHGEHFVTQLPEKKEGEVEEKVVEESNVSLDSFDGITS